MEKVLVKSVRAIDSPKYSTYRHRCCQICSSVCSQSLWPLKLSSLGHHTVTAIGQHMQLNTDMSVRSLITYYYLVLLLETLVAPSMILLHVTAKLGDRYGSCTRG